MKKRIISIAAAVIVLAATFFLLQRLLMPKYISVNEEGGLAAEYYDNAGNNDVIFIGDCEVYTNYSPIKMWTERGITSYIRGTPQQMIWQAYYMLEDALRYETPKVVIYNVLSMKHGEPESEAYNRLALDGMRWSSTKYRAIKASMTEDESVISYIFPLLRYHSRWSELTAEDFKYMFKTEPLSHNGYLMRIDTKPAGTVPDPIPLPDYSFAQVCWDYLEKIRSLCEDNGIQLILVKAPTLYPAWYPQWEEQIEAYAKEHGLTYLNFLEKTDEIGIDYTKDTFDAGMHLNLSGAEKLSAWLADYLAKNTKVSDRRGDAATAQQWQKKIEFYEAMQASQKKQLEENGSLNSFR